MTEPSDPADKRTEPRYAVSSLVPAEWNGTTIDCAASDISRHGIFLEMPAPPPIDTLIRLGPPGGVVKGRVVFTLTPEAATSMARQPGVGVALDAAIDPD